MAYGSATKVKLLVEGFPFLPEPARDGRHAFGPFGIHSEPYEPCRQCIDIANIRLGRGDSTRWYVHTPYSGCQYQPYIVTGISGTILTHAYIFLRSKRGGKNGAALYAQLAQMDWLGLSLRALLGGFCVTSAFFALEYMDLGGWIIIELAREY